MVVASHVHLHPATSKPMQQQQLPSCSAKLPFNLGWVWAAKFADVHRYAWHENGRCSEHVVRVKKSRQASLYGLNFKQTSEKV